MNIPEASSSSHRQSEKLACILVRSIPNDDLEWYTFDISDDPEHDDQPAPPSKHSVGWVFPFLPPPPASYHKDDQTTTAIDFKPTTTAVDDTRGWAILGDSNKKILYCIHEAAAVNRYGLCCIDLLSGTSSSMLQQPMTEWKVLPPVPNKLASTHVEEVAHILVLGGKVYCLGGSTNNDVVLKQKKRKKKKKKELDSPPWAMAFDPSLDIWESLPNPPRLPEGGQVDYIFSAGFPGAGSTPSSPCIVVVGLPMDGVIQFYDVDTKIWRQEEFYCDLFSPKDLRGKAVAVGNNLLYWYALDKQCLVGYDVTTKTWFIGYVPLHDLSSYWADDKSRVDAPPSLAHLGGGDMFCLFWNTLIEPVSMSRNGKFFPGDTCRFHCMKFRVTPSPTSLCPGDGGIIRLEPTIMSCQSYLISGTKFFCDGLVV